jgi:hypothetical protein
MTSKPEKCPDCGSDRVASILYGLPGFTGDLKRRLDAGEVILGGCCVSDYDPIWQCIKCQHRWGRRELSR